MEDGMVMGKYEVRCKNLEKKFSRYSFDNLRAIDMRLPSINELQGHLNNGFETTFTTVLVNEEIVKDPNYEYVSLSKCVIIKNNQIIKVTLCNINTMYNVIVIRKKLIEVRK